MLTSIYEDKRIIEAEKQKSVENSQKIEELKSSLEFDFSKLQQEQKDIISKAKYEARDILLSAKDDANEIIKELQHSQNSKESNKLRNKLNEKIDNLNVVNSTNEQNFKTLNIDDLEIGMKVFVNKINQDGNILSISKDKKIQVALPLGKMFFDIKDLQISNSIQKESIAKKDYSSRKEFKAKSISSEINVIGQNVDEACFSIDKYLDNCVLSGLPSIRIVHGKGTGALRTGIHKFLKSHPHVKSFRVGTFGEGEMGVTIVELK